MYLKKQTVLYIKKNEREYIYVHVDWAYGWIYIYIQLPLAFFSPIISIPSIVPADMCAWGQLRSRFLGESSACMHDILSLIFTPSPRDFDILFILFDHLSY